MVRPLRCRLIIGFKMPYESRSDIADFATYTTGKQVCNNKVSIICWHVVYVTPEVALNCCIWQAYSATLMANKQMNSRVYFLSFMATLLVFVQLTDFHGMSNILHIFVSSTCFCQQPVLHSNEVWDQITTVIFWESLKYFLGFCWGLFPTLSSP